MFSVNVLHECNNKIMSISYTTVYKSVDLIQNKEFTKGF